MIYTHCGFAFGGVCIAQMSPPIPASIPTRLQDKLFVQLLGCAGTKVEIVLGRPLRQTCMEKVFAQ